MPVSECVPGWSQKKRRGERCDIMKYLRAMVCGCAACKAEVKDVSGHSGRKVLGGRTGSKYTGCGMHTGRRWSQISVPGAKSALHHRRKRSCMRNAGGTLDAARRRDGEIGATG